MVEAYLAVVAGRAGWSFDLEISVAPDARNLPMPAMLLLPMVR